MFPDFLHKSSTEAARRLLGCYLEREIDGLVVKVRIVETESYDATDAASHSFNGKTLRNEIMFGEAGFLYVYFTYGMHYCCNVVTGEEGKGSAVLIRAVEPVDGEDLMAKRRGRDGVEMSNGPAKLCQALGIDRTMNGHDLHQSPLRLYCDAAVKPNDIITTTRIGISKAKNEMRRFYIKDNPYVSRA